MSGGDESGRTCDDALCRLFIYLVIHIPQEGSLDNLCNWLGDLQHHGKTARVSELPDILLFARLYAVYMCQHQK